MWRLPALGPHLGAEGRGPLGDLLPGAPEAPEPPGARPSGAAAPAPAQGSVWLLQLHLLFLSGASCRLSPPAPDLRSACLLYSQYQHSLLKVLPGSAAGSGC